MAVRVAAGADAAVVDDLAVVVDVLDDKVLEGTGGFLAVVVAVGAMLARGLLGELAALPTAIEVRRAVPVVVGAGARFFSSSEADVRGRCDMVEVVVEAAGRLVAAVVPVAGRFGGLCKPPAVFARVAELVVECVADFAGVGAAAPGRRAAEAAVALVPVRFGAGEPGPAFLPVAALGEVGDCAGAGSGAGPGVDSGAGCGTAGASVCWTA